jgi:MtN3 and saliva related transmembrane protein
MNSIQILGLAAGICTSFSVIPLLVKTIQEKKASDVCWIMIIVLIVKTACGSITVVLNWTLLFSANIFPLPLNTAMLFCKWKYNKKNAKT